MTTNEVHVNSPNVKYEENEIVVNYNYSTTNVERVDDKLIVSRHKYESFKWKLSSVVHSTYHWFSSIHLRQPRRRIHCKLLPAAMYRSLV